MKIALQFGVGTFFEECKSYCDEKSIHCKIVNCYDNNAIVQ